MAVNSYVTLKHVLTLDGDRVRALLLKHTDEVADGVGLYSNYIGEGAADAEVIVTLAGVDREWTTTRSSTSKSPPRTS